MSKKITSKKIEKVLKDALIKRAMGYESKETVEEYVSQDDSLTLTKRKVTIKQVPPDTSALKALFDLAVENDETDSLSRLTDEELEEEKNKILNLLKGEVSK